MNASISDGGATAAPAIHAPRPTGGFDLAQASAEGWGVFDCGLREDHTSRIEIQRIDFPDDGSEAPFTDDQQAWQYVLYRAQAGSVLHLQALRMVDPIERLVIEGIFGWWPDP